MRNNKNNYDDLIWNLLPSLWRRRRLIFLAVISTSCAAFLIYSTVGERYEAYTLLRVGQGIKDRATGAVNAPFGGEGIDLTSRLDSLARIGATDHVIEQAARQVGVDRLVQGFETTLLAQFRQTVPKLEFFDTLRSFLPEPKQVKGETKEIDQELIQGLRSLVSAKQEGRSDLLRISFRYPDPAIAAEFLNKLANSLVATQADLVQVPGAEVFFQQQTKRLELEAEKAAADLQNFSVAASIYSVADQRGLLLKRANELASLMATTRGTIEERKGQKQAILDQLQILKPVTQSKTVSAMVNSLAGPQSRASAPTNSSTSSTDDTPPLLLIRLYQDAMAALLKVNYDISGSTRVEKMIGGEIEQVNAELAALSSKEAEYDRLKRILTRASAAAEHYGTRMGEEQISSDIAKKTQLSNVRVVQIAESPISPLFPTITHLGILAILGGIAFGSAIVAMLELLRMRLEYHDDDEIDNPIDEFEKKSLIRRNSKIQAAE